MGASWLNGTVIANPMSAYPEYQQNRASWFGTMSAAVVEVVRASSSVMRATFSVLSVRALAERRKCCDLSSNAIRPHRI